MMMIVIRIIMIIIRIMIIIMYCITYDMVSIMSCSALFDYVLLYVILFGSIILCYGLLYHIVVYHIVVHYIILQYIILVFCFAYYRAPPGPGAGAPTGSRAAMAAAAPEARSML